MNDNKLEMNEIERQAEETVNNIEEKKFKKILKNNEEYRLAKEIMEKYNKKAENYVLKKRIKTQFLEEQQKTKKILEMKEYLKEDN